MKNTALGPRFHDDGTVTFRVWAPACESLQLQWFESAAEQALAMQRGDGGVFTLRVEAEAGRRYWFRLPGGALRPDPASRFQPDGVHGPSQLIDEDSFAWTDSDFRGVTKQQMVLYELHVGAYTAAGSYDALIERFDEMLALGINAIELMPVVETAGKHNWGYDGVNLFAPRNSYGTPDELRRLVNAAHQAGLSVILDVVYNHFGAEGNYLHEFGGYVSQSHTTPWGDAPNFDESGSDTMRRFIVDNALYWIESFHFDGLRLDAIHCMADRSETHVVHEIGQAFAELQSRTDRPLHLIAESNIYDPELLQPLESGGHGFDAIWCDDFLHSVSAILRPDEQLSSRQYRRHDDLDLTLRRGFVYHQTLGSERLRIADDEPVAEVPIESLILSIQNHDFVGNHPDGKRLHQWTSLEAHKAAAALMLVYPAIPMLFMGEESAADQPFFFFTDFGDEPLRQAVEQGRQREYPQHDWTNAASPLSLAAFQRSKLESESAAAMDMRAWYRQLITLRLDWQQRGMMAAENMTASWSETDSLATVTYRNQDQSLFALIRLHAPDETPPAIAVDIDGEVLLSNACTPQPENLNRWSIERYSVLIGRGSTSAFPG
ncbi:malto-oligosyltrehalose trehalohydrolase [Roseimaritima ulvae]|uniref:Malto-oligosyltrehalose trehalohydrolase n=1 Tax=Roseimaritima ulvae TaxID=980254 RepID=A0A5B9QU29_9BACT|nr:malto-oligosyltrehalose trehalohydrolase [Roseimaritima ulvae]QEG42567.1 Malto-oligosyltrehalose trehalohydrolase [Roseimaritima ulvae]